jgi:hypothetical protein
MAISSNRLDALPRSTTPRGRTPAASTKPFLARVLAAVRRSTTAPHGRHRRHGQADREMFAASFAAGITRGASMFVDNRRRG